MYICLMQEPAQDMAEMYKSIAIGRIVAILQEQKPLTEKLQHICELIPSAFPDSGQVSVRLSFEDHHYVSSSFIDAKRFIRHAFTVPDGSKGEIELLFQGKRIKEDTSISTTSAEQFLALIASLIIGLVSTGKLSILLYDNTERLKELKGIKRTTEILSRGNSLESSLREICSFLPEAWQYPLHCAARIRYGDLVFNSRKFNETKWVQSQFFETPDNQKGSIEVYYLKNFPEAFEGPFLKEERDLIDNLAALISGTVSHQALRELLAKNTERLKELKGINQTSMILKESKSIGESLKVICSILPDAYQFPEYTVVRIQYENMTFTSRNFRETDEVQHQEFDTPNGHRGIIEVFYLKEFPKADEGPFLKEERNLLINLANLIAGSATKDILNNLLYENRERLKELHVINHTSYIISQGKPIDETLQKICYIMPRSWQYSRYTAVRIGFEGRTYAVNSRIPHGQCTKRSSHSITNKEPLMYFT
jgi:hypothetical protein